MFYLYFEDFVGVFVGPFSSREDAENHWSFRKERGDSSAFGIKAGIVSPEDMARSYWNWNVISPKKDKQPWNVISPKKDKQPADV